MKTLSRDQMLLLHSQLIDRYGGTHGGRDEGLLDSALSAPFHGFGDYEFFQTVIDKAVRLSYGLIVKHPFHDGNKRIGALALLTILDLNNVEREAANQELEQVILDVASGAVDYKAFHAWVLSHI